MAKDNAGPYRGGGAIRFLTKEGAHSGDPDANSYGVHLITPSGTEGAWTFTDVSATNPIPVVSSPSADFLIEVAKGNVTGHSLIRKFGRNEDIDTAATETVWAGGGSYTFPDAAETLDVSSTSTSDDVGGTGAESVTIYGLNGSYVEISEVVTMDGTTTVTTSATFLRVNRVIVTAAGSAGQNVGTITAVQTTSGITVASISPGLNQTQLGVYTVPNGMTAYLLAVDVAATKAQGTTATVDMFVRPEAEVFQLKGTFGTAGGTVHVPFEAPEPFAEHTDIRFDASVTANNTQVGVEFPMLLVTD